MCSDWGMSPQPWHIRVMLSPTELPGQGPHYCFKGKTSNFSGEWVSEVCWIPCLRGWDEVVMESRAVSKQSVAASSDTALWPSDLQWGRHVIRNCPCLFWVLVKTMAQRLIQIIINIGLCQDRVVMKSFVVWWLRMLSEEWKWCYSSQ